MAERGLPPAFGIADLLILDDGRVVAFRWRDEPHVLTWLPGDASWRAPELSAPVTPASWQPFAQGADGRIYTWDQVIDPSTEPWTVESLALVTETEVADGLGLDAGPNGVIYRKAGDTGHTTTQLVAFDPLSRTTWRTSVVEGSYPAVIGTPTLVYAAGDAGIVAYDPSTDRWSVIADHLPHDAIDSSRTAAGPDEPLYVLPLAADVVRLWAWDVAEKAWLTVEPPPDVVEWSPTLAVLPDGRLLAASERVSFLFTPAHE